MNPIQNLAETLPNLSQTELREVQVRVQALLTKPTEGDEKDLIYEVMSSTLKSVGIKIPPTLKQAKKTTLHRRFNKGTDKLLSYCNQHFQFEHLTRMEQRKLLRTLLTIVLSSLPKSNIPITPSTMCDGLGRIDVAIEEQFPNYLASGLLMAVLHGELAWQT